MKKSQMTVLELVYPLFDRRKNQLILSGFSRVSPIFHDLLQTTKLQLFQSTLLMTSLPAESNIPNVHSDPVQASASGNLIFVQVFEQLHLIAHRLFRQDDERLWRAQYLNMYSTDLGGPYPRFYQRSDKYKYSKYKYKTWVAGQRLILLLEPSQVYSSLYLYLYLGIRKKNFVLASQVHNSFW